MYTPKSVMKRGTLFGAAVALVAATTLPAVTAFADALNPLTERSLLLTSSAPGWQDTDGSGNSESNPNAHGTGEYYAPAGSGPNGKKTGETFSFRVSTDSAATNRPIKSFTLQYCTTPAGLCQAPGNNTGDARTATADREDNATAWANKRSDLNVNYPTGTSVAGTDYKVYINDVEQSTGWTITASNKEDDAFQADGANNGALTGKNNFITLTNSSDTFKPAFNDQIKIVFAASTDRYITNPGSNAFFVKMNTYDSDQTADMVQGGSHNIDGGVTVANVMTDSIHITTKVLETMAFSVGTRNPDTDTSIINHGSCDAIQVVDGNRLALGNVNAESSLRTDAAYDVNSYWRLSSNSSGGATVYYSGDTLRNTVGDHIQDMPTEAHSVPGTEQFGLALVDASLDTFDTTSGHTFASNHITPNLSPLTTAAGYDDNTTGAVKPINNGTSNDGTSTNDNARFMFKQSSSTIPEILASNTGTGSGVVSCATAKVRYIGNIAADTPAGVYTTKINYLAAPQY